MKVHLFSKRGARFTPALLFLVVCAPFVFAAELEWSQLEQSLRARKSGLSDPDSFLSIPELESTSVRTNSRVFVEMAIQAEYPFVSIAGLVGLKRIDPRIAYQVSFGRVWGSTNVGSPLILPFVEYLSNRVSLVHFAATFSMVTTLPAGSSRSAIIAIYQIPLELLRDWLQTPLRMECSLFAESIVIERVISETSSLTPDESALVQARLREYKDIPGLPRAVFLLHGASSLDEILRTLRRVLVDQTVDMTMKQMLLRKHAKSVQDQFILDDLPVSNEVRERFRQWITKYGK